MHTLTEQDKKHLKSHFTDTDGRGAIFLIGLARSGTSWLAKILDSHPDVLYRHEPDIEVPELCLPWFCAPSEKEGFRSITRAHLEKLVEVRTLRTAGPLPVAAKRHRTAIGRTLRTGLIIGLRAAEIAIGAKRWPSRVSLPDFISAPHQRDIRVVVKSVNAVGYARLFAEAWPQCRIVTIVRHPCGYVESQLRGLTLGKISSLNPLMELMRSSRAERLGLKIGEPEKLSTVEQLAWEWAFLNQSMLDQLCGLPNVKTIMYGNLTADPTGVARDLFAFVELPWVSQVETFISESTTGQANERYFGIKRDPIQANNKWRGALPFEDQQRILAIARRVAIGRTCTAPSDQEADFVATADTH
jgi:hypothetical protein